MNVTAAALFKKLFASMSWEIYTPRVQQGRRQRQRKQRNSLLSVLETALTSAGREGDTNIYISIRQVALCGALSFEGCIFTVRLRMHTYGSAIDICLSVRVSVCQTRGL